MDTQPSRYNNPRGLIRSHIAQQQQTTFHPAIIQQRTIHHPAITQQQTSLHAAVEQQKTIHHPAIVAASTTSDAPTMADLHSKKKRRWSRVIAITVIAALAITIFLIWHSSAPATASSASVQQSQSNAVAMTRGSATAATSSTDGGSISVYVTGAVKHPGIYTLDANARVYQLLQAAGGPLPNANLVALNLAAKLTDGQEVYVLTVGETPPTYVGGVPGPDGGGSGSGSSGSATTTAPGLPVNINTASVEELNQGLHVSSTTAQKIVDYRTQYGPYTSVDQLTQVVSRSIYDRIKNMVTVS
jgi:competence protein ComEA